MRILWRPEANQNCRFAGQAGDHLGGYLIYSAAEKHPIMAICRAHLGDFARMLAREVVSTESKDRS